MANNLQLATIRTQNFTSIGVTFPSNTLYEKNRRCLFEDEKYGNNINCSNESTRYTGTLLICDNHLRQYFKLVIQEFNIREIKDMVNSKYIKLVYARPYKHTIPFPFQLNTANVDGQVVRTLCLKPDIVKIHDDRPASFFASINAFASNGIIRFW